MMMDRSPLRKTRNGRVTILYNMRRFLMSKKGEFRQFHVNFWQATAVEDLDPTEKLLYIYFITSPRSNMEGVYKTTLRRIAFETGIDRDMVVKIAGRFADLNIGGIARDRSSDVWVIVSHSPEFMTASPSIQTYFSENIGKVPLEVVKFMNYVGYRWPKWAKKPTNEVSEVQGVHTPYTPPTQGVHTVGTHVSDTDTDTNTKTNTDTNTIASADAPAPKNGLSPLKDKHKDPDAILYNSIKDIFLKEQPGNTFKNWGKEGKAIKQLIADAKARSPDDPSVFVFGMIATFKKLREEDKFFGGQPFTPSALNASGIYDRVMNHAKQEFEHRRRWEDATA